MKVSEQVFTDGNKLIVKETHDIAPTLERTSLLRSAGHLGFGESRHVADVPMALIAQWARDAGVKWDDKQAMQDLLKRKLLDGEFSKFRVWEGRY